MKKLGWGLVLIVMMTAVQCSTAVAGDQIMKFILPCFDKTVAMGELQEIAGERPFATAHGTNYKFLLLRGKGGTWTMVFPTDGDDNVVCTLAGTKFKLLGKREREASLKR